VDDDPLDRHEQRRPRRERVQRAKQLLDSGATTRQEFDQLEAKALA
jgi:hypothetical protein